ncbi:hypothetical protein [Falsiroseomonas sp.]|uniref:hypothetical protein n=1 Tax=Falsiroseomonas sp. TaxID=2870721 RepID=UPI002722AF38|nr:hypothetical protein [Falsiroseomonas sp.]MDO9498604.1 hypothetical protein [Falsiroseomonas sp.]
MVRLPVAIVASVLAIGAMAPQAALADWRYRGYGHHPHQYRHYNNSGAAVLGGALLGLGIGAALGAALAPPAVIYAPPPVVYYPPPPVVYYQPPPAYWAPVGRAQIYAAPPPYYDQHYASPAPVYAPPPHDGGWK